MGINVWLELFSASVHYWCAGRPSASKVLKTDLKLEDEHFKRILVTTESNAISIEVAVVAKRAKDQFFSSCTGGLNERLTVRRFMGETFQFKVERFLLFSFLRQEA